MFYLRLKLLFASSGHVQMQAWKSPLAKLGDKTVTHNWYIPFYPENLDTIIVLKIEQVHFTTCSCVYITKICLFKYIENFNPRLPPPPPPPPPDKKKKKKKKRKISDKKNSDIFHISAQNIACGYSLEPQSMFLSRNKKINVYPCKH